VCACDRADALFKTFDLNKYPLLKEGLIKHKGSYVRGDEDIPQVYILGRPFGTATTVSCKSSHSPIAQGPCADDDAWSGSLREVMDSVATGQLEARLRLTRSQRHFYA
jgi:hypothetical protein